MISAGMLHSYPGTSTSGHEPTLHGTRTMPNRQPRSARLTTSSSCPTVPGGTEQPVEPAMNEVHDDRPESGSSDTLCTPAARPLPRACREACLVHIYPSGPAM